MDLRPSGGLFWRLDSSGNLTAYNTVGTILAQFVGGFFSTALRAGSFGLGSDETSADTTQYVQAGGGVVVSPKHPTSPHVLVLVKGHVRHSANGGDVNVAVWRDASLPGPGNAATGTKVGEIQVDTVALNVDYPFSIVAYDSPAVGNADSYYLAIQPRAIGTATLRGTFFGGIAAVALEV